MLAGLLLLYGTAGMLTALAFAVAGAPKLLSRPAPVSVGARILLLPGALLLWPLIAVRWIACLRTQKRKAP